MGKQPSFSIGHNCYDIGASPAERFPPGADATRLASVVGFVFSPKGWDYSARGNAPGFVVGDLQPEGLREIVAALQAAVNRGPIPQGVALG
jgi:hypothetical protein